MMSEALTPQPAANEQPITLFWEAVFQGRLRQLWAQITRRCFCLLDLDQMLEKASMQSSHYVGLKTVSINNILGTQGKGSDFDAEFNPTSERTRSRWLGIAKEKLRGHDLPPVELIQVENIYFVRDGHHRISVSRSLGQNFIDAEVTVMLMSKPLDLR